MIIKRCNSSEFADQIRRKRRKYNDSFPFEALGNLTATSIPFHFLDKVISIATEISPLPAESARPPVVRTSRGRAQVLPSKFNDSVLIDPWKREKSKLKASDNEIELVDVKIKGTVGEFSYKDRNLETLLTEEECYRACRNLSAKKYLTSWSTLTSVHEEEKPQNGYNVRVNVNVERRKDYYFPQEFVSGDIVWAKSGKKFPAWPAIVIDPMQNAPELVVDSCMPGAICVMFFGYSRNGHERDYAWVKQGMIFPFIEYLDRFQGQTQLYDGKPGDFRLAIEEAFLAENGFLGSRDDEMNMSGQTAYLREIQEATDSNHDQECQSHIQAGLVNIELTVSACIFSLLTRY